MLNFTRFAAPAASRGLWGSARAMSVAAKADVLVPTADEVTCEMRIDRFLRERTSLPQGHIQKALRKKQIFGRSEGEGGEMKRVKLSGSDRLREGLSITVLPHVLVKKARTKSGETSAIGIGGSAAVKTLNGRNADEAVRILQRSILWEDDHLIVVNKPGGVASQGGAGVKWTLPEGLQTLLASRSISEKGSQKKVLKPLETPLKIVHRLDKGTSGVMVLAKTRQAAMEMAESFKRRRVVKEYWALVEGHPVPAEGTIRQWLTKHKNGLVTPSYDNFESQPTKVTGEMMGEGVLSAETNYRVLSRLGLNSSWVALYPETGRKHQLRVHCASALRSPILGDTRYANLFRTQKEQLKPRPDHRSLFHDLDQDKGEEFFRKPSHAETAEAAASGGFVKGGLDSPAPGPEEEFSFPDMFTGSTSEEMKAEAALLAQEDVVRARTLAGPTTLKAKGGKTADDDLLPGTFGRAQGHVPPPVSALGIDLQLHARALVFPHPVKNMLVYVRAEPPKKSMGAYLRHTGLSGDDSEEDNIQEALHRRLGPLAVLPKPLA